VLSRCAFSELRLLVVAATAKPGSVGSVGPAAAAAAAAQAAKEESEDEWDPTEILTRGTIEGLNVTELKKALKARGKSTTNPPVACEV
jgi:hypothetical protein